MFGSIFYTKISPFDLILEIRHLVVSGSFSSHVNLVTGKVGFIMISSIVKQVLVTWLLEERSTKLESAFPPPSSVHSGSQLEANALNAHAAEEKVFLYYHLFQIKTAILTTIDKQLI